MKKIFSIILFVLFNIYNSQSLTILSEKTNLPLTKVLIFGKDGDILATSDIDGKIDRQLINSDQEKFNLVHENISLGTFSYNEINKDIIKLNDRIKDIEEVVIKNNKPAKYILIKGNFNTYVTLNNRLNCYLDGIITYVFDNKTKKLKTSHIEQYRIFRLESAKKR
jgi:hypothetical protein